jgi:hypothetical protein
MANCFCFCDCNHAHPRPVERFCNTAVAGRCICCMPSTSMGAVQYQQSSGGRRSDRAGREKRRETRVLVTSSYYADCHKQAAHLLFARLTRCRAFVRLSGAALGRMVVCGLNAPSVRFFKDCVIAILTEAFNMPYPVALTLAKTNDRTSLICMYDCC